MFPRRKAKTHGRMAREELNRSLEHLRLAAGHAAESASSAVTPRVVLVTMAAKPAFFTARRAVSGGMGSVFDTARSGSRQVMRLTRRGKASSTSTGRGSGMMSRRWPAMVGGLVAVGAAAGVAGALVKRRRDQRMWDEYGTTRTTGDSTSMLDSAKSSVDAGIDKASAVAEEAKERADDLVGAKHSTGSRTGSLYGSAASGSSTGPGTSGKATSGTSRTGTTGSTGTTGTPATGSTGTGSTGTGGTGGSGSLH